MVRLASFFWPVCSRNQDPCDIQRARARRLREVQALVNDIAAPQSRPEQATACCF
jgi:hypothetical protein